VIKIGTDIYMEWEGKTEEDRQKQYTGFSIEAGNVGYLRASIRMYQENSVLRLIFPVKYWEGEECKEPYDFIENLSFAVNILVDFMKGENMEEYVSDKQKENLEGQKKMGEDVMETIKKTGFEEGDIVSCNGCCEGEDKKIWAKSIVEFFRLGIKLQEKGLKPYPYISW
jgi:hypothetical protein